MFELDHIKGFYPKYLHPFPRNLLREYLQYKILETIFEIPKAANLSFMGGTCIHILHGSERFSEDLDFDNRGLSGEDFELLSSRVQRSLNLEGYTVEQKVTLKTAYTVQLRFSDILQKAGLSRHREEKLNIHIDAEPQEFEYVPRKEILNRFGIIARIQSVPPDILLAQKVHCIFSRKRLMGRDFFDAAYLLGKTKPNYGYLRSKLGIGTKQVLKEKLLEHCAGLDLSALSKDAAPFLFDRKSANGILFFPQLIESAL